MKAWLALLLLCLLHAVIADEAAESDQDRLLSLSFRRSLAAKKKAAKPQRMQFRMVAQPNMCAAGKSSWVDATGAGPLHLETCKNNRGGRNPNTVFLVSKSATNPGMRTLARQNANKKNFCLHNFGGGFAVLSMINPCVPGPEEMWNLQNKNQNQISWTGAAAECWDTMGNFFVYTRIGLAACDLASPSQRFKQVLV